MSTLNVVQFPESDIRDVPRALRELADGIERGDYGDAHNVAWICDMGNGEVAVGMAGGSPSPGAEAHLLFAKAQHVLETG